VEDTEAAGDGDVTVAAVDWVVVGPLVTTLRDCAATVVKMAVAARRRQEGHLNGRASMPTVRCRPAVSAGVSDELQKRLCSQQRQCQQYL
jgi:hypothetical protein